MLPDNIYLFTVLYLHEQSKFDTYLQNEVAVFTKFDNFKNF